MLSDRKRCYTDENEVKKDIAILINDCNEMSLNLSWYDKLQNPDNMVHVLEIFFVGIRMSPIEYLYVAESALQGISPDYVCSLLHKKKKTVSMNFTLSTDVFSLKAIYQLVRESKTLLGFSIYSQNLNDGDAREICTCMSTNTKIDWLELYSNNLTEIGALLFYKMILARPDFKINHMCLVSDNISLPMITQIKQICNANKRVLYSFLEILHPVVETTCFEAYNCLRCYEMPVLQLETYLSDLSQQNKLAPLTNVFIFKTPMDAEFMSKWFSDKAIGQNLETLALIKCRVGNQFSLDYVRYFPKIKVLKIIN